MDAVEQATENLVEALVEAICAALIAKSFFPSEKLRDELYHVVRSHIGLNL